MNLLEIIDYLRKQGLDPYDVLNFKNDPEEDKYHIVNQDGVWEVYYFERGNKWEFKEFQNEADASDYLCALLKKDGTLNP